MRKDQANSDRLEVLRDLATYEVNFTKHSYEHGDCFAPLRQRLKERLHFIKDVRGKLKMRVHMNEDGEPVFQEHMPENKI